MTKNNVGLLIKIIGVATTAAVLIVPVIGPRLYAEPDRSAQDAPGKHDLVESFFWQPQDVILVTHSGEGFLRTFPEGVNLLAESGIRDGLAVVMKLRDEEGRIVGFASELEVFPEGLGSFLRGDHVVWDTVWTLTIPNRGSIFLYQLEHEVTDVTEQVISPAIESGKTWEGDVSFQTTYGPAPEKYGVIVGGTGEFIQAAGRFVEIDRLRKFTPAGKMHIFGELRIFWDRKPANAAR